MEPYALGASACRHRGPARGAAGRGQPGTHLPDRGQPQRHTADHVPAYGFNPAQHCPRLPSEFRARVDAAHRTLRAFVRDCSVGTTGDVV